jgi:serine/threonine protein phosphatase PrpC
MAKAIPEAISKANLPLEEKKLQDLILNLDAQFRESHSHGGSTAAMVIASPVPEGKYHLQISHVGDSRVIVGGTDGTVKFATEDHKPSNPDEKGRIEKHGGHVKSDRVDGRLAMSRALGDDEFKRGSPNLRDLKVTACPSVKDFECKHDEFVLIACDGVFEAMTNEAAIHFVAQQLRATRDLGKVVASLVDEALRLGSGDNITAILLQFKNGETFNKEIEFVPGPVGSYNTNKFRKAYIDSVTKAGLTVEKSLELRFQQLTKQLSESVRAYLNGSADRPHITDLMIEVKEMGDANLWGIQDLCNAVARRLPNKLTPEQYAKLSDLFTTCLREVSGEQKRRGEMLAMQQMQMQHMQRHPMAQKQQHHAHSQQQERRGHQEPWKHHQQGQYHNQQQQQWPHQMWNNQYPQHQQQSQQQQQLPYQHQHGYGASPYTA